MLEVEDGRFIMNTPSDGEGQTRRVKVQIGGIGSARYPSPARFLPLLYRGRFGERGAQYPRWECRRHIGTRRPKGH